MEEKHAKELKQVRALCLFALALVVLFSLGSLFFHDRTLAVSAFGAAIVAFISITLIIRRIVNSEIDRPDK